MVTMVRLEGAVLHPLSEVVFRRQKKRATHQARRAEADEQQDAKHLASSSLQAQGTGHFTSWTRNLAQHVSSCGRMRLRGNSERTKAVGPKNEQPN